MRATSTWCGVVLCCALAAGVALAVTPAAMGRRALFNTSGFRPQVVIHELPTLSTATHVTITGVVFSHAALEKVTIGDRTAVTRQAEPRDLVRLQRVPDGATDAPYRTYFELTDTNLPRVGANDLDIVALGSDGRLSDVHRLTILRTAPAPAAQ